MLGNETIPVNPLGFVKTKRGGFLNGITSGRAGKIIPITAFPLLREDRIASGRLNVKLDMAETAELLMNAVQVTVRAEFVPYLAFDRFSGEDAFNRSYTGEPEPETGNPIPFFNTYALNTTSEFAIALGLQGQENAQVNSQYLEAYNVLVNHRRQIRSGKLQPRNVLDETLAPAFWPRSAMSHIVPDFDDAKIDGEVPLTVVNSAMPVRGIGILDGYFQGAGNYTVRQTRGTSEAAVVNKNHYIQERGGGDYSGENLFAMATDGDGHPAIFAEMQANGITVSLSNMELAKDLRSFAQMRARYKAHYGKDPDDEHLVDLLMAGVRVPQLALQQPILLDKKTTVFGYNQRFSTTAGALDEKVADGVTGVTLNFRTPPMNTGGVVIVTAEIVPDQLYERQQDFGLHVTDVDALPNATRDMLDPQKVTIVKNSYVDARHSNPDETFGYAPLNHEFRDFAPRVGGKFYKPDPASVFDEDRQRIWAVETVDPELTEDFMVANGLHEEVFASSVEDTFEITHDGQVQIVGLTQFGKGLQEASDDYDKILADVDTTRIDPEQP